MGALRQRTRERRPAEARRRERAAATRVHVRPPLQQSAWLSVAALTAASVVIHVWGARRPLWNDEAATWWTVQANYLDLLHGLRTDGTPPLYFALVKLVASLLGDSEFALRVVSLVAGGLSIPLGYVIAKRFLSARTAVLTALLIATAPLVHVYAVEARNYALLQLETLAILWATLRLVEQPSVGRMVALAACLCLSLVTHHISIFLVPAPIVAAVVASMRSTRSRAVTLSCIGALLAVGVAFPWLVNAGRVASQGVGDWIEFWWQQYPPSMAVPRSIEAFGAGGRYPAYIYLLGAAPTVRLLSLSILVACAIPAVWQVRRGTRAVAVLCVFAAVPLLGMWMYSIVEQPIYVVGRYDTVSLLPFLMLLAVGCAYWIERRGAAGIVLVATFMVLALLDLRAALISDVADNDVDVRAARQIAADAHVGDTIIATGYRQPVTSYYLHRYGLRVRFVAFPQELADHPGWVSQRRLLANPTSLVTDAQTLAAAVADAARAGHGIWVLGSGPNPVDAYLYRALAAFFDRDESGGHRDAALEKLKLLE